MLGMALFLTALGMLFAASMLGYLLIRFNVLAQDISRSPEYGQIDLPWGLWLSTAVILASSYTIHRALQSVRHERQARFRHALTLTAGLAVAFLLVQAPSLTTLLQEHRAIADVDPERGTRLYGLIFFLILLHAMHLVGGMLPLLVVTYHAHRGRYDHEHFASVQYLAMYWHFLDVVWLILFGVLLLAG